MRLLFATLAVLFVLTAYAFASTLDTMERASATRAAALCETDSDCAALCPADDAECDGGPQS